MVEYIMWGLFTIYSSFQRLKNFENQLSSDQVIAISTGGPLFWTQRNYRHKTLQICCDQWRCVGIVHHSIVPISILCFDCLLFDRKCNFLLVICNHDFVMHHLSYTITYIINLLILWYRLTLKSTVNPQESYNHPQQIEQVEFELWWYFVLLARHRTRVWQTETYTTAYCALQSDGW